MTVLWEVTRRDAGVDVDVYFECALRARFGAGSTVSAAVSA